MGRIGQGHWQDRIGRFSVTRGGTNFARCMEPRAMSRHERGNLGPGSIDRGVLRIGAKR